MTEELIWRTIAELEAQCGEAGEVPAGAVLARDHKIVATGRNRILEQNDPVAVAEMDCIRQAGRRNDQNQLVLYSSRSPSMLVAGTLLQFSIGGLVIRGPESESSPIVFLRKRGMRVEFSGA